MCGAVTHGAFDVASSEGMPFWAFSSIAIARRNAWAKQAARNAAIPTPRVVPRAIFALRRTPE